MPDTAFMELYHASYSTLFAQISSYLGDPAEAEDVVQEAYLRTWQRWDRIARYEDPVAYLRRVAWNLATSRWRRLAVAARHLRREAGHRPVAELQPDHVAMVTALKQLPERQRQAIVLHHIADLPVEEVARELGAPRGTVLSWLHRGRQRLATLLDDAEPVLASKASRPVPPLPDVRSRLKRRRAKRLALAIGVLSGTAAAVFAFLPSTDPVRPPVDTIMEVNWADTTIDFPAGGDACPAGRKDIRPHADGVGMVPGPRDGKTDPLFIDTRSVVFGDLTGDGEVEAIAQVWCSIAPPDPDIEIRPEAWLLVVGMRPDRTLYGLGYVGPAGAHYLSYRVADGELLAQLQYESETVWTINAPGHVRTYRYDGETFRQTSGRTEPLVLLRAKGGIGSPVELAEIRSDDTELCPRRTIRFGGDNAYPQVRWVDLDSDGNQEGIVQVRCHGVDSLYLLGQGASAFETLDIPFANDGSWEIVPDGWDFAGRTLTIQTRIKATGELQTFTFTWDGRRFQAAGQ